MTKLSTLVIIKSVRGEIVLQYPKKVFTKRKLMLLTAAAAMLVFFIMNVITPYCMDDYSYMVNFVTKNKLSSIGDIFESLSIHYTNVNGRMITHFFAHLFCLMGKTSFNIINTVAFGLLCALISRVGLGRFSLVGFLSAFCALTLLTPSFGQSFLWQTGASNYLFSALIIFAFLTMLYPTPEKQFRGSGMIKTASAFVFGIIAGATLENLAAALCFYLLCMILLDIFNHRKIHLHYASGFFGALIGLLTVILAPGQRARLVNTGGFGSLLEIIQRMIPITGKLLLYFAPLLIIDIILLVCFLRKFGLKSIKKLIPFGLLFASALASVYSMALSPMFPSRVWSGPLCLMISASMALLKASQIKERLTNKKCLSALFIVMALTVSLTLGTGISSLAKTKTASDSRDESAQALLHGGKRDLILPSLKGSGSRFDPAPPEGDITSDIAYWTNVALARYYGADSVSIKMNK